MDRRFNIKETAREKLIVTAHRGVFGGNIPPNTLTSYEIALNQGADMIETDVDMTADGQLVIFHPGMEKAHLCYNGGRIRSLTLAQIREKLRYNNIDNTPTEYSLNTFDELLETFHGRCYINVDKFSENPVEISKAIHCHGMEEQIIVKTAPHAKLFDIIEQHAPEIQYLPIITEDNVHEELLRRHINYIGAEVVYPDESSPLCGDEYIDKMHRADKLVWVNAIVYSYKAVLSAGHSDDTALRGDPEKGWGWLADRGYDIIQTDWPLAMTMFLDKTGRLYRGSGKAGK